VFWFLELKSFVQATYMMCGLPPSLPVKAMDRNGDLGRQVSLGVEFLP
jgi:hypothetical protein